MRKCHLAFQPKPNPYLNYRSRLITNICDLGLVTYGFELDKFGIELNILDYGWRENNLGGTVCNSVD